MVYGEAPYGEAPYAEGGDSGPVLRQAVEHSTALPIINPSAGAIPQAREHSHALPLSPGQVLGVARDRQDAGRLTPSTGIVVVPGPAAATAQAYAPTRAGVFADVLIAAPTATAVAYAEYPTLDVDPPVTDPPTSIYYATTPVDLAMAYPAPILEES